MWNIIIGIAMIIGGLSGEFALRGTNSGPALAGLGGLLIVFGIYQLVSGGSSKGNDDFGITSDDKQSMIVYIFELLEKDEDSTITREAIFGENKFTSKWPKEAKEAALNSIAFGDTEVEESLRQKAKSVIEIGKL